MEDEREAFQNYLRELKVEHLTSIDDMKELSAHADTYLEVKIALIKQLELEAFQKSLKMMDMKAKLQTRIKEKAKALERKPKAVNPSFRAYLLNRFFAWESNENPQYTADTFVPPAHLEKTLGEGCHFLLRLKNARGSSQRYVISFDKAFAEVTGLWLAGEEDDISCRHRDAPQPPQSLRRRHLLRRQDDPHRPHRQVREQKRALEHQQLLPQLVITHVQSLRTDTPLLFSSSFWQSRN